MCAFLVIVCIFILATDGWRTYQARRLDLQEGEVAATNIALAIGQHVADTLKEPDAVVLALVDRLESFGTSDAAAEQLEALLVRFAATQPQIERLAVFDENGRWIATSMHAHGGAGDVSRREFFQHHRDEPSRDAYLGHSVEAGDGNQWVLTLSRRVNGANGSFKGVVVASIDIDYFKRFFDNLEIGKLGTLVLATKPGVLLTRRPHVDRLTGSSLARTELFRSHISRVNEGFLLQVSALDQVERQIAFKNLDEYPLYVVASLATEETLAQWRTDAITHSTLMVLLIGALACSGFWIVRRLKESGEFNARLVLYQDELELLNRKFSAQAREDGLTGLANRRELDRVLDDEVNRARRNRTALAFVLLDIDCFKVFNDLYGHLRGDDCLREVAAAFTGSAHRPGDLLARYGGEEFAVVLPGVDLDGATAVATKICRDVRALSIKHAGSVCGVVTISAGVSVFDRERAASVGELIRCADEALYAAKRGGRNRVVACRQDAEPTTSSLQAA